MCLQRDKISAEHISEVAEVEKATMLTCLEAALGEWSFTKPITKASLVPKQAFES